jgi:hypothetical protein
VFAPYAAKAGRLGWPVREITADHEALATAPHLLASAILELAGHPAAQPTGQLAAGEPWLAP